MIGMNSDDNIEFGTFLFASTIHCFRRVTYAFGLRDRKSGSRKRVQGHAKDTMHRAWNVLRSSALFVAMRI
jgi:hypothetical protein